ncbi:lysophospholipid acyltransferase family protein [Corynebacterium epidermidicanis]|uniref:1-acyl-sn-glycerol-3-phosphate acyltransferase n=1 Tax=Corynebacterium epidermidicanis TaxID=1050174 RepID=A0A0G3GUJ0_9CORY|nr:lysophospholipid acyltransferase family protein [Corynebacterium epidermidicanis]AKK04170.1 1-acyl-sn-glycerol-3-phosphate acyltransferase [Corynebacterium epidermidicanis]
MASANYQRKGNVHVPADFTGLQPQTAEAREGFYGRIVGLAQLIMRFQGLRIYIDGAEKIPASGGALLAFNHTGYFDFILGGIPAHVSSRRLVRYMSKKEIFDTPVVGAMMRKMGHLPVDREKGSSALDIAVAELQKGSLVGIFPEATISRSFEIKEIKSGAVRIANAANVPLIPVTIWGSQRLWTKDLPKNLGRSHTPILIKVGDEITVTGDTDADNATLHTTMSAQLDEVRTAYEELFGPFASGEPWLPESLGGSAPTPERAELLTREERELRAAKKARTRAKRIRKIDIRADRKAMDVLMSRGWIARLKARMEAFGQERRER